MEAMSKRVVQQRPAIREAETRSSRAEDVLKDKAGWVTEDSTVEIDRGPKQAGLSTRKTLTRIESRTGWVGNKSGSGSHVKPLKCLQ